MWEWRHLLDLRLLRSHHEKPLEQCVDCMGVIGVFKGCSRRVPVTTGNWGMVSATGLPCSRNISRLKRRESAELVFSELPSKYADGEAMAHLSVGLARGRRDVLSEGDVGAMGHRHLVQTICGFELLNVPGEMQSNTLHHIPVRIADVMAMGSVGPPLSTYHVNSQN